MSLASDKEETPEPNRGPAMILCNQPNVWTTADCVSKFEKIRNANSRKLKNATSVSNWELVLREQQESNTWIPGGDNNAKTVRNQF